MTEWIGLIVLVAIWTAGELALWSFIRTPQRYLAALHLAVAVAIGIGVTGVIRG